MLRVGMISYVNVYPILGGIIFGPVEPEGSLHYGIPSDLNGKLRRGLLDVAFISSVEFLKHQDLYEIVGNFCVAAYSEVRSVSLFTRRPLCELHDKRVGLTTHSASSVHLLQVLCHHFWGVRPRFEPLEDSLTDYEAYLLIGNQCLNSKRGGDLVEIDLAAAWYHATGLPFTFALMTARRDLAPSQQAELSRFLDAVHRSRQWCRENEDTLIQRAQVECPLSKETLQQYFSMLHFDLGAHERRSLTKFQQLTLSTNRLQETHV